MVGSGDAGRRKDSEWEQKDHRLTFLWASELMQLIVPQITRTGDQPFLQEQKRGAKLLQIAFS